IKMLPQIWRIAVKRSTKTGLASRNIFKGRRRFEPLALSLSRATRQPRLIVPEEGCRLLLQSPPGAAKTEQERHRDRQKNGEGDRQESEGKASHPHDVGQHRPGCETSEEDGQDRCKNADQSKLQEEGPHYISAAPTQYLQDHGIVNSPP